VRIPLTSQFVNDWPAGIAEAEKFRHFVKSFTSSIVAGVTEKAILL